jgi:HAD superfamily hydrolase (TIGR01509 family)
MKGTLMTFPWDNITWVLLDMDGTLLDKHFDDYFWETLVPEEYARRQGMELALARDLVFARYQREEGTLNWTDIDFWSRELELDIPALKEGIRHLIEVHPDAEDFLKFLRLKGKLVALVTNAHYKTVSLKLNHTGLTGYFNEVVSSFDLGAPKEEVRFWEMLQAHLQFDGQHTLLVDDNAEALAAAQTFGIKYAYFKAKSSSRQDAASHPKFPSIASFYELMD